MRHVVSVLVLTFAAAGPVQLAPAAPAVEDPFTGRIHWVAIQVDTATLAELGLPTESDSVAALGARRLLEAGAADHPRVVVERGTYLVGERRVRSQPEEVGPANTPVVFDPDVPEILLIRPDAGSYLVAPEAMIPGVGRPFPYEAMAREVESAGARDTVAGYPVEAWDIHVPEGRARVWTAAVPVVGDDAQRVARSTAVLAAGPGRRTGIALAVVEHGFPLRILHTDGDEVAVEEVTGIEPGPVPADRLSPPPDFQRVEPGG